MTHIIDNRGNPNHDPDGKFGTGPSGGSKLNIPKDSISVAPGVTYYHGTSKENAKSLIEHGYDQKRNKKGFAESPYGLFLSKSNLSEDDHSAGTYGDTIVKVSPQSRLTLLDGLSDTWSTTMGSSKSSSDSSKWAKVLAKDGYDGIDEGNGELVIWNTKDLKFTIDTKLDNSIKIRSSEVISTKDRDKKAAIDLAQNTLEQLTKLHEDFSNSKIESQQYLEESNKVRQLAEQSLSELVVRSSDEQVKSLSEVIKNYFDDFGGLLLSAENIPNYDLQFVELKKLIQDELDKLLELIIKEIPKPKRIDFKLIYEKFDKVFELLQKNLDKQMPMFVGGGGGGSTPNINGINIATGKLVPIYAVESLDNPGTYGVIALNADGSAIGSGTPTETFRRITDGGDLRVTSSGDVRVYVT